MEFSLFKYRSHWSNYSWHYHFCSKPKQWLNETVRGVRWDCRKAEHQQQKVKYNCFLIFLRETSRCYQRTVKAEKNQADNIFNNCHKHLVKWTLPLKSLNLTHDTFQRGTPFFVFLVSVIAMWSSPRFDSGARLFFPLQPSP